MRGSIRRAWPRGWKTSCDHPPSNPRRLAPRGRSRSYGNRRSPFGTTPTRSGSQVPPSSLPPPSPLKAAPLMAHSYTVWTAFRCGWCEIKNFRGYRSSLSSKKNQFKQLNFLIIFLLTSYLRHVYFPETQTNVYIPLAKSVATLKEYGIFFVVFCLFLCRHFVISPLRGVWARRDSGQRNTPIVS